MAPFTWADAPNTTNAFPIARPGYPYIAAAAFATAVFALLDMAWPAILGLAVTAFICYFFRDPDRVIPSAENAIVSPADGRVVFVGEVEQSPHYDGPCRKISIFMSVFNVHVNRSPVAGTVSRIDYVPGRFVSAHLDKASLDNEHNAVRVTTNSGQAVSFVQIAGLIARRIICRVQPEDSLDRGQRFGMICFGSRVDLFLPLTASVTIAKGATVHAGTTQLGTLA